MFCRSLIHRLLFNYEDTKIKIQRMFKTPIDDNWWNPAISWTNKYKIKWTVKTFFKVIKFPIPVQFSDAFHTFNTIELGGYTYCIAAPLSIAFAGAFHWLEFAITFVVIGFGLIVLLFNLGYDNIWKNNKV